jgi:hypothetical protein
VGATIANRKCIEYIEHVQVHKALVKRLVEFTDEAMRLFNTTTDQHELANAYSDPAFFGTLSTDLNAIIDQAIDNKPSFDQRRAVAQQRAEEARRVTRHARSPPKPSGDDDDKDVKNAKTEEKETVSVEIEVESEHGDAEDDTTTTNSSSKGKRKNAVLAGTDAKTRPRKRQKTKARRNSMQVPSDDGLT